MHLVLGITGKVGGAAARHLLKQSYGVAGLVPICRTVSFPVNEVTVTNHS